MHFSIKNNIILILSAFLVGFLLSSCDSTKYLAEGESFARENRIVFESTEKIKKKSLLKEELSLLFRQDQNNNWIGRWVYYNNQDQGDTLWYHNFARRFFASEPIIFNESLVQLTASEMQDFLRNKRGFYKADVNYKLYQEDSFGTGVDYIVNCGKRYTISSIKFKSTDPEINEAINDTKSNSFLRAGDPVSSLEYELEKSRISNLLQNQGYAQFFPNYIQLEGDSSNYMVDLTVNILNPNDTTRHKKFHTGDIKVYTDYHPNQDSKELEKETFDGKVLYRELDDFFVKPGLISSMISMETGDLTSRSSRQESYNRLSKLTPYKFIAIKQQIDSIDRKKINYDILLIPKPSIWDLDYGFQFNYTTLSEFNKLFGLGLNVSIQNDNLFGGAERFVSTIDANTDIQVLQVRPQELYLQNSNSILFPEPINLYKYSLFNPLLNLSRNKLLPQFKNYASTRISVGANYQRLDTTINIISANVALGYQFNPGERQILHFNQIAIDFYYPTEIDFEKFPGQFYRNSLSPRVITGFLFKDIAYSYTSKSAFNRFTWQLYSGIEFSGHEIYFLNLLYNTLSDNEDIWQLNPSAEIKFAKYGKSHIEYRAQLRTGANNKIASRLYIGVGLPYGDNSILPYTKQFFVGGPQSIRAWEKRGLGPGSYIDPNIDRTEIAYQKGDIKLEANVEYRFDLPWYFEGAVFMDAGNIWNYSDDINIEGENFTSQFYKEIAVAGGIGLRLNFNFLLLRLDLGYKLRTPYVNEIDGSNWQIKYIKPFKDGYLTFGLDYPF